VAWKPKFGDVPAIKRVVVERCGGEYIYSATSETKTLNTSTSDIVIPKTTVNNMFYSFYAPSGGGGAITALPTFQGLRNDGNTYYCNGYIWYLRHDYGT